MSNLKILWHICETYNCDYLPFFNVKSPSNTQRSVSQEKCYKKSKNPSPFSRKTIGSNNSFTLIEINFRFLR